VTQTVTGELTLHAVTNTVEIEVEGALQDGLLVVVGSTEIQFADYAIEQPVSMSVASIADHGTMEFQIVFELVSELRTYSSELRDVGAPFAGALVAFWGRTPVGGRRRPEARAGASPAPTNRPFVPLSAGYEEDAVEGVDGALGRGRVGLS
jgi:hypothetical protein